MQGRFPKYTKNCNNSKARKQPDLKMQKKNSVYTISKEDAKITNKYIEFYKCSNVTNHQENETKTRMTDHLTPLSQIVTQI